MMMGHEVAIETGEIHPGEVRFPVLFLRRKDRSGRVDPLGAGLEADVGDSSLVVPGRSG
jgi:hypothetical protein